MPAPFPSPGDSIGRFRVLSQLGAGGMGVVYEALETTLERKVALKVISPMYADDADFRSRFASEARALGSLDSPHVVQVYAHGEEDGYLYIATQLIPDGDLGQMIVTWGPPPQGKAVDLIEQVARGLADAHAAGLVHRDIKPANVLVRRRGAGTVHAYLGDFGIARRIDAEVTRIGGGAVGTPSYMAPELHSGAPAVASTDVYALGCLLWVVLTGRPPYEGTTEMEIVTGHISRPVPQLLGGTPLVQELNRILRVSMAKEPGHRYRTAVELRDDLRDLARLSDDPAFHRLAGTATSAATALPGAPGPPVPPSVPSVPSTPSDPGSTAQRPGLPRTPSRPEVPTEVPAAHLAMPARVAAPPPYRPSDARPTPVQPSGAGAGSRTWWWVGGAAVLVAVLVGTLTAVLVGGDGGGGGAGLSDAEQAFVDSDAATIVREAEKEMGVLTSVRIVGTVDANNGTPGSVDLVITGRGDCEGEVRLGDGRSDLRRVDGTSYLKPDREFFAASDDTLTEAQLDELFSQFSGRWIQNTSEQDDFEAVCDIDELIESDGDADVTYEKGEVADVEGTRAIRIDQTSGEADAITAWIAVSAPHYLIKLEQTLDDGSYVFSEFDEPFSVEAPSDVFTG
ncbi:protein kinase [Nocardioides sp. C4-1]|uniref:serine/threonine protein kinase n=1 Tax=Nocardioides sp. C4-1 TaxID=3151851 RepID=UPI0032678A9D